MKRPPNLSRRTFIKLTATMAAGAALASCTPNQSSNTPAEPSASPIKPTLPPSPTSGVLETETLLAETPPPETNPTETVSNPEPTATKAPAYLAVVHGPDPAAITRAAIDAFGGMASFVSNGYDVLIKPNICTDYN